MRPVFAPTPGQRRLGLYLIARVVPALVAMVVTFVCIHALSAEQYGLYSLTLLPASIGAGLVGGLAGQAMLRHAHELTPVATRHGLLTFPLIASSLVSVVVLVCLAATVGLRAEGWIAAALVPAVAVTDTRRSLFVAQGRAAAVFALDVVRAAALLCLVLAMFHLTPPRSAAPLLAQLIAVLVALLVVRPGLQATDGVRTREVDRAYVGYGLWFAGWMALIGCFSLAERVIVETSAGIAASGDYAARADIVNAVFAATGGALASALMPAYLAQTRHGRQNDPRRGFARLLRIGLAGVFATALCCVAAGVALSVLRLGRIATVLTSDAPVALTLVAAATVWTAAGFVQKPLELRGQTRLTFMAAALSLLAFVLIGPASARAFGPLGVAGAKLAAGLVFVSTVRVLSARVLR